MTNEENEIMEMVRFGVLPGTPHATVEAHAGDIDAWLSARKGFVRRALVGPDTEGRYTDIVHWRTMADASAAAAEIMKEPSLAAFMGLIDGPTVTMAHVPVVATLG